MPAFFFLFLWYPVAISSSATCRQLVRLEALCIQKHPQCQAANARQLLLVSSTESCSPQKRKVTSRPSDTHRGWILCQLECRELGKKGGGQLWRQRINYHLQQIITGEGVWKCGSVFWGTCVGLHFYISFWLTVRMGIYLLMLSNLVMNTGKNHY